MRTAFQYIGRGFKGLMEEAGRHFAADMLPKRQSSTSCVGAILEWAQLPENGFFHDDQENFIPQRGI